MQLQPKSFRRPLFLSLFVFFVVAASVASLGMARPAPIQAEETAPAADGPLCRYGIAASEMEKHVVPMVDAGWFLKFNWPIWYGPLPSNGSEQVHVLKTFQLKDNQGRYLPGYETSMPLGPELANYISNHPGGVWIIGNEVDRGPELGQTEGGQGDMYPEIYAMAYHEIHGFIKANDPTARVANSALVQVTPGRMQYLDRVWNAHIERYGHPMLVDIWNMHLYALPEVTADGQFPNSIANIALGTDLSLGMKGSGGDPAKCPLDDVYCKAEHDDMAVFAQQVRLMRQWMKNHGQQQKPLMLSEFSILYGYAGENHPHSVVDEYGHTFSRERVSRFMVNAFDYLNSAQDPALGYAADNNRLVQQWLWFAAYSWWGSSSDLVADDLQTLTLMGKTFRDYVAAQPRTVDLAAGPIPRTVAVIGPGGTAVANLRVPIRNAGSAAVSQPFRVSFYADAARTQLIGSAQVTPHLRGCATSTLNVPINWPGLRPGLHNYWVHVDSEDVVVEAHAGNQNNVAQGEVRVHAHGVYMPAVIH